MVLYRPLSADRLRTGVKSALGLRNEGEDARESLRASIRIPATLRGAGLDQTLAFITNLSAGGAALYVGQDIPSSSIQTIEFSLPGEKKSQPHRGCRIGMERCAGPHGNSLFEHIGRHD